MCLQSSLHIRYQFDAIPGNMQNRYHNSTCKLSWHSANMWHGHRLGSVTRECEWIICMGWSVQVSSSYVVAAIVVSRYMRVVYVWRSSSWTHLDLTTEPFHRKLRKYTCFSNDHKLFVLKYIFIYYPNSAVYCSLLKTPEILTGVLVSENI